MQRGITISYENWIHHGEPYDDLDDSDDDMPICEDSEGDNDMDDEDLGEMLNNIGESRGGTTLSRCAYHNFGKNVTAIDSYEIAHYYEKKKKMVSKEAVAVLKEILAVENLRAIVESEKNKSEALVEKLKEVAVEQDEMKKCMRLMMKEIQRLSKLVPDKSACPEILGRLCPSGVGAERPLRCPGTRFSSLKHISAGVPEPAASSL
nr:hypothetical protein [Tanacetum cinerariifolium]